jgi:hypothetical protein
MSNEASKADEVERLARLHESGALSADEYAAMKSQIIKGAQRRGRGRLALTVAVGVVLAGIAIAAVQLTGNVPSESTSASGQTTATTTRPSVTSSVSSAPTSMPARDDTSGDSDDVRTTSSSIASSPPRGHEGNSTAQQLARLRHGLQWDALRTIERRAAATQRVLAETRGLTWNTDGYSDRDVSRCAILLYFQLQRVDITSVVGSVIDEYLELDGYNAMAEDQFHYSQQIQRRLADEHDLPVGSDFELGVTERAFDYAAAICAGLSDADARQVAGL